MTHGLEVQMRHRARPRPRLSPRRPVEPRLPRPRAGDRRERRAGDSSRPPGRDHLHPQDAHPAADRGPRGAQPQVRRAAGQAPAVAEGRLHDPGQGLRPRGPHARRRLHREGPAVLRSRPRRAGACSARHRGEGRPREAPARARDLPAPRPPPRRLPHRLRPRRLRPQVRGGRGRQGRLLRRGRLEPVLREGPLLPLPGDQRHAPARGRAPAAHRRASAAARPAST